MSRASFAAAGLIMAAALFATAVHAHDETSEANAGAWTVGAPTPGGIADLSFLPDGSLVITSTPSTADGDAGALFHVARPQAGVLSPRLVRRFPGLKPEGISLSLSPGKLMVVFDAGAEVPSFLELPWQG